MTENGKSPLTLSGNNCPFIGTVTDTAGTLALGRITALDASNAVTVNGGTLDLASFSNTIGSLTVSKGNVLDSSGSAAMLTIAGAGNATVSGGTVSVPLTMGTGQATVSGGTVSGAVVIGSGGLLINPSTGKAAVSGGVSGTGNITITSSGTATVTLGNGTVNNTGSITNNGNSTGLTTISGSVGYNVTAITENSPKSALTVSGAITIGPTMTLTNSNPSGSSLLTVSGGVTGSGNLALNNNSATANGITLSGAGVNVVGTITNAGNGTGTTLISAALGVNVQNLTENGTAPLTLSGNNTAFTGNVRAIAGTLKLGTAKALNANNTVVVNGGTFDLNNFANTVGNLTVSSGSVRSSSGSPTLTIAGTGTATVSGGTVAVPLTIGSGGLVIDPSAGNAMVSGNVSGTGNITISSSGTATVTLGNGTINNSGTITNSGTGNGTTLISAVIGTNVKGVVENSAASQLILSGNNKYSGGSAINTGTLEIGTGGSLGTGAVTDNGALLFYNTKSSTPVSNMISGTGAVTHSGCDTLTLSGNIAGGISVTKNSTGTLILTGNNTYSGNTTISTGMLQVGSGGTAGTLGSGDVECDTTLVFDLSSTYTASNSMTGSGTLIQAGTGILVLAGDDLSRVGATSGMLTINQNMPNTTVTVSKGATLNGDGTVGAIIVNGGTVLPGYYGVGNLHAGSATFNSSGSTLGALTLTVPSYTGGKYCQLVLGSGGLTLNANVNLKLDLTSLSGNGTVEGIMYSGHIGSGVFTISVIAGGKTKSISGPLIRSIISLRSLTRSASENSPVLPHSHLDLTGLGPFGLCPALGAHRSPQLAPTPQARRQIFRRLCVKQISCHSADTFSKPRNRNLRMPRADLIWPNTGSTMCLRAA